MSDGIPDAVVRLGTARGDQAAFLLPCHVEAARRLAFLFERARLQQRVTMSYDPARVGSRPGGSARDEISASAADARRQLGELAGIMPQECWSLLFDICGLDRGLQDVEAQHDWPRRGGKLVLRIALSQLAAHYGLDVDARGKDSVRQRGWLPERPSMFPAEAAS